MRRRTVGRRRRAVQKISESAAIDALTRAIVNAILAGYVSRGFSAATFPAHALLAAANHAAKLVVEIDGTTEAIIRRQVSMAVVQNWTTEELQDRIAELAFSRDRALRIARTEAVMAFNRGEVVALRADGFEFVEVVDGSGCLPLGHDDGAPAAKTERGVQAEREADGQIWALEAVEAEDLWVGHPNCRRALIEVA